MQSLHFSPMTLSLHGHIPFESHDSEVDPWRLQLQAGEKKKKN